MSWNLHTRCTAFVDGQRVAAGELRHVAIKAKQAVDARAEARLLVFDDRDGSQIELDLRGNMSDLMQRLSGDAPITPPQDETPIRRGRGRPRLGVTAREVTLLPRHWQWLNAQPGGASVALRKLVEDARRRNAESDRARGCQEAAYRFMHAMAGDLPGFEDATRALFAQDVAALEQHMVGWPDDIREHALMLAADALHH
ncbi:DUF2239 family protein [Solilutibacter silvestris]|uniref:DUF2239 domain-containing protein n=1 Tax=Solilutibacter silvestris TaxID=1645665 RepID=A0A2K1Q189_9GAMM|nr:DUF2239 family protein [Lysobacter silvestris]PNS08802.1 hypothetical protein Lysil_0431 [Lysobacter silvestris]